MSDDALMMNIKIYAPFRTYFDGKARSLSGVNATGPFDVLPKHKNFMSLLQKCTLIVRSPGQADFQLPIERGVMHVKADKVTVFLDV